MLKRCMFQGGPSRSPCRVVSAMPCAPYALFSCLSASLSLSLFGSLLPSIPHWSIGHIVCPLQNRTRNRKMLIGTLHVYENTRYPSTQTERTENKTRSEPFICNKYAWKFNLSGYYSITLMGYYICSQNKKVHTQANRKYVCRRVHINWIFGMMWPANAQKESLFSSYAPSVHVVVVLECVPPVWWHNKVLRMHWPAYFVLVRRRREIFRHAGQAIPWLSHQFLEFNSGTWSGTLCAARISTQSCCTSSAANAHFRAAGRSHPLESAIVRGTKRWQYSRSQCDRIIFTQRSLLNKRDERNPSKYYGLFEQHIASSATL